MHHELVSDRKKPKLRRNNSAEVLAKEHKQYKINENTGSGFTS